MQRFLFFLFSGSRLWRLVRCAFPQPVHPFLHHGVRTQVSMWCGCVHQPAEWNIWFLLASPWLRFSPSAVVFNRQQRFVLRVRFDSSVFLFPCGRSQWQLVALQICADVLHRAVYAVQLCVDDDHRGLHQGELWLHCNAFIVIYNLMASPFAPPSPLGFAERPGDVHRDGVQWRLHFLSYQLHRVEYQVWTLSLLRYS